MRKLFAILFAVAVLVVLAVAAVTLGGRRAAKQQPSKMTTAAPSDSAPPGARRAVVVELFTSEGCSSCPPADALLSRLDKTQPVEGAEVIPLAMHVDYWNNLGWADPFSSAQFSERQGEYAAAFGNNGVYTPQMVVDGVKEFNGGDEGLALEALNKAASEPKAEVLLARTPTQTDEAAGISVQIDKFPKQTEGDAVYVFLAVTESGLSSDVSRGENTGRKLTHVGVVRLLKQLSVVPDTRDKSLDAEIAVPIEKNWRRENLRAVVFAQERGTRRVLAAGSLKLFG